jgi:hypothetical protein
MIKHLLLAHFAHASSVNNIDIQFKPDGSIVIPNLNVTGSVDQVHEGILTIDRARVIDVGERESYSRITGEMIAENGFRFGSDLEFQYYLAGHSDTKIYIGIGPGSPIVARYGSISVLRTSPNNGSLILGDSQSSFGRFCAPDTLIVLPYEYRNFGHFLHMQHWLKFATEDAVRYIQNTTSPVLISGGSDKLLTVPLSMAETIIGVILGTGARQETDDLFSNCHRELLMERLPVMELRFPPSRFILYPDDYMTFNNERYECGVKFNIPHSDWADVPVNPLRFPNVNVHVTRREIFLCDSAVDV